jgi:hypothetical protein
LGTAGRKRPHRGLAGGPDQVAVTQAAHRLEQALMQHPLTIGIPRNASVNRTAIDLPLGIDYEVIEDDKLVRVLRVWAVM